MERERGRECVLGVVEKGSSGEECVCVYVCVSGSSARAVSGPCCSAAAARSCVLPWAGRHACVLACARRIDLGIYERIHVINHVRTHTHTLIHKSTDLDIYISTLSYAANMSLQSRLLVAALALTARHRPI